MASSRRSEPRGGRRPGSPRARLFVALDLPEPARRSIAAWRDTAVAGRDDLRPVPREALHVTLCFLGWQPEREARTIGETVAAACSGRGPAHLAAAGLEPLPPRRPRLFALDLRDAAGRASAVQSAVADALAAARVFEPERRPFWAHLTLARVKRGRRAAPLALGPPPGEPFEAARVTLYRSTLRPQGALYEPLASVPLEG